MRRPIRFTEKVSINSLGKRRIRVVSNELNINFTSS